MKSNYANARAVLPKELFEKIQAHYTGFLYIPSVKKHAVKNMVLRLTANGASSKEIAVITGLSHRRINQIRAEYRETERKLLCE